jgi:5-methylcytosine-specific restriction endonuclease McrA
MLDYDFDKFAWESATETEIKLATKAMMNGSFFLKNKIWKKFFKKQKGRCAICGVHQAELDKAMALDHNHITEKNRGLLCSNCNLAIGLLKCDNGIELLEKAIKYIGE